MKLSPRLEAIANMITGSSLIDVGCDHALLDVFCAMGKNMYCIASDISKNALENARKNVEKYHLEDKITLHVGNGLEGINVSEDTNVVISGMGTNTILSILKNAEQLPSVLIIQSNKDLLLLRKEIVKFGYLIADEVVVKEGKIFNVIIKFVLGEKKYSSSDYYLGPILRGKKDFSTKEYYQYLLKKEEHILASFPDEKENEKNEKRKIVNLLRQELIEKPRF